VEQDRHQDAGDELAGQEGDDDRREAADGHTATAAIAIKVMAMAVISVKSTTI
jgi:hypothetical protein